jgi:hypothetical protein
MATQRHQFYGLVDEFPGSDRKRASGFAIEPQLAGDVLNGSTTLPFRTWAAKVGFRHDSQFTPLFSRCGSAAEVFFLAPFLHRQAAKLENGAAVCGKDVLTIQVPIRGYRADAVLTRSLFKLAIEIDGLAFHHRSAEQIASDYLRQRRIVCAGHTVIRFTAAEVFGNAAECWRQIDIILEANC